MGKTSVEATSVASWTCRRRRTPTTSTVLVARGGSKSRKLLQEHDEEDGDEEDELAYRKRRRQKNKRGTTNNQTPKRHFWPPWPFSLLTRKASPTPPSPRRSLYTDEEEDQDYEDADITPRQRARAPFWIWILVRDSTRLTLEQMRQVTSQLWFHLPPGMPPFVLMALVPRRVKPNTLVGTSEATAIATTQRVIPLFANPFVRSVALSGLGLALMSWAHYEIHRKRQLTPLGMEYKIDLPAFLPEEPQAPPDEDEDNDKANNQLSRLAPQTLHTAVSQWKHLRLQRAYEQKRAHRLSIQDQLLARQARLKPNHRRNNNDKPSSKSSSRLALVTGASRGIGRAIAVELARYGIDQVLVARDGDKLTKLATDLEACYGIQCYVVTADLAQPEAAFQLYQATRNANLHVDILVNNAGYSLQGPLSVDMDVTETNNLLQCNAVSVSTLTHLYGRDMKRRRRGRILNMSSICGAVAGIPTVAVYSATKAFCNSLSAALALELEPYGVGVTCVLPGAVKNTQFKARSDTKEALCWKWPGYAKTPERVARASVKAMLRGDTECTPGIENRIFLRVLKPAIPQRIHNIIAGIFWNPLQLPFARRVDDPAFSLSDMVKFGHSSKSGFSPRKPPEVPRTPPKRLQLPTDELEKVQVPMENLAGNHEIEAEKNDNPTMEEDPQEEAPLDTAASVEPPSFRNETPETDNFEKQEATPEVPEQLAKQSSVTDEVEKNSNDQGQEKRLVIVERTD